ncbi:MAG TPA: phosphoglycerate mutase family protein [Chthoniobacterales bacterium]|nr:phosphoglycerate mutase family protein [Chthoniobacterales bacterium]
MKVFGLLLLAFLAFSVASAQPFVVIVRHAEKLDNSKDPDLSAAGQARAERLVQLLKDAKITAIFTTELKRTQETAAPLAKSIGITPTIVSAKDYAGLVSKLHQVEGAALVVGHGNTIPDIVKALGIDQGLQIADEDYTDLLVVSLQDKPQMVRLHY